MPFHIEAAPNAGTGRWRADHIHAAWPGVGIDSVEVVSAVSGPRVCAVVRLGALLPADVEVELRPAPAAAADVPPPRGIPMWSTQSYANGCFVFEAVVPPEQLARSAEWSVHVRSENAPDVRAVLAPPLAAPQQSGRPASDRLADGAPNVRART